MKYCTGTRQSVCLLVLTILSIMFTKGDAESKALLETPDIIPTPKLIELSGKRFVLSVQNKPAAKIIVDTNDQNAAIAVREINDRVKALGGQPLPIGTDAGTYDGNLIILGSPQIEDAFGTSSKMEKARKILSQKGEQGYAIQFDRGERGGREAILYGAGRHGLLHAGSTFRLLIKREGETIYAIEAQITDWPDFKNRGLPVWPLPASFDDFKTYVDWAFRYKFNRIYTNATGKRAADGFNLPTYEERLYLKRINAYAKERGIKINYALSWAVATVSPGRDKDDYQGAVQFKNRYYTWSDDNLLRKRAAEIAQFASETDTGSLLFHCIDTYEEGWDKRRQNDRARFGDDRAAADANVINIFTTAIRRINPGIELQFVVYPYHANINLPGNERYKAWLTKLSASIPHDVYLIVAELDKDQSDSWISAVKQPLFYWINGNAFQWGRYFSTLPAFTKTAYYEGRDRDIIIHWEPIGPFNGEVMQLVAAEYEWNVNASGMGKIVEERAGTIDVNGGELRYRKETVDGSDVNWWAWYNGTQEPKPTSGDLLLKVCRLEFGEAAAPFVAEFFKNNPIGWRSPELFSHVLQDTMAGRELEACSDQLIKTNNALMSLKKAIQAAIDSRVRTRLNVLLKNTYHQGLAITGTTAYYKAMKLSTKGLVVEASQELKNGRSQMVEIEREMERQGIWSKESPQWFEAGDYRLKIAEARLNKGRSKNLLNNPGFEEPRDSTAWHNASIPRWLSVGSVELIKDSHRGKYAVHATLTSSDSSLYLEQMFAVPQDCQGYVEFWMKKDAGFRVIPILQFRDKVHAKKTEILAVDNFPFNTAVQDYESYSGKFHLPSQVTHATFKIYADWYGFIPTREKNLYFDDVFVGCVTTQ